MRAQDPRHRPGRDRYVLWEYGSVLTTWVECAVAVPYKRNTKRFGR